MLLLIIFVGEYNAQDIHLSQFYASDHLLNPSKMGDFEGDFETEMKTGEKILLTKGMTYVVSDELSSHRSYAKYGVKLLIIDGEFLKQKK